MNFLSSVAFNIYLESLKVLFSVLNVVQLFVSNEDCHLTVALPPNKCP